MRPASPSLNHLRAQGMTFAEAKQARKRYINMLTVTTAIMNIHQVKTSRSVKTGINKL